MSRELWIDISKDATGQLTFAVGPSANGQKQVLGVRAPYQMTEQVTNELRLGQPKPNVVQQVSNDVSQWVLGGGLQPLLAMHLGQPNERVRVIWNIADSLRRDLADIPFEIIYLQNDNTPYVAKPQVAGFTHFLKKYGIPPTAPSRQNWGLRCLLVRSSPQDLGGGVPRALPLIDQIRAGLPNVLPKLVEFDVLTSEQGAASPGTRIIGPPTYRELDRALQTGQYDLFIYVGHGDFHPVYQDREPIGLLQLEDETRQHLSLSADKVSYLFQLYPVPAAMLLGCLTAAEVDADAKAHVDEHLPEWLRGSEGVAQALVNGASGVALALGMRYRTEADDAGRFLTAFFSSLVTGPRKGDFEEAVGHARRQLYQFANPSAINWVAPVLFSSTLLSEPVFPHLTKAPNAPDTRQLNAYRKILWESLRFASPSAPDAAQAPQFRTHLDGLEQQIQDLVTQAMPLLMPTREEALPGVTVDVKVRLIGAPVNVQKLEIAVTTEGAEFTGHAGDPALAAAGYDVLLKSSRPQELVVMLQRQQPAGGASLPTGPLLNVSLRVGPSSRSLYPVGVEVRVIDPEQPLHPEGNAVLVLAP